MNNGRIQGAQAPFFACKSSAENSFLLLLMFLLITHYDSLITIFYGLYSLSIPMVS